MPKPTPEQLARINQFAKTPLTEDQVYVFTAKMLGTNYIPKFKMKVTPNLLAKLAEDAKNGVALIADHSYDNIGNAITLPFGRTFDAHLQQDGDELALYADHYIVRGLTIAGVSTDDIIAGIETGTIFDTSAGFIVTDQTCSICGLSYFNSPCPHIRGNSYDGQLCYTLANDGYLMENSLVFDGAYEGAGIVNLSQASASNTKSSAFIPLEDSTKTLPDSRVFYCFSNKTGFSGYVMKPTDQESKGDDHVNELEQAKQQLSAAQSVLASVREALKVSSDTEITGALASLSAKAKLGEQYAARVIDEACAAGVRALGDAFNVEAMKLAFSNLPVQEVEKIRDSYEAQAKAALGGGGRHTVTDPVDLPAGAPKNPQAEVQLSAEEKQQKAREAARAALAKHGFRHLMKEGE